MKRRVVVTGMGVVSALGFDVEEYYNNLLAGKSGISKIERFDASEFSTQIAGEIKDYDPSKYFERNQAKRMDRFCQYAMIAAMKAMEDSKIDVEKIDLDRAGVITASGIGGMETFQDNYAKFAAKGPRRISPLFIPMMISDISAGRISIQYGFKGPNYGVVSACASSGHAIGNAFRSIQYGDADVMICGGSEAPIIELGLGGFAIMRAISTRNDSPETASRPFDKDRDGFVMAEGGGMLILEDYEHAKKRGAKIYAEVKGIGFSGDAHDIVAPPNDGDGARRAMAAAIKDAGISTDEVDHVNTHGTSTPAGDIAEVNAIKELFGEKAYKLAINSTKSMTGHLLGAAGAVELIATIKAVETNTVHPTMNIENQDPECDLDFTKDKPKNLDVNYAISNTFGFGGHNCSLVVSKFKD